MATLRGNAAHSRARNGCQGHRLNQSGQICSSAVLRSEGLPWCLRRPLNPVQGARPTFEQPNRRPGLRIHDLAAPRRHSPGRLDRRRRVPEGSGFGDSDSQAAAVRDRVIPVILSQSSARLGFLATTRIAARHAILGSGWLAGLCRVGVSTHRTALQGFRFSRAPPFSYFLLARASTGARSVLNWT